MSARNIVAILGLGTLAACAVEPEVSTSTSNLDSTDETGGGSDPTSSPPPPFEWPGKVLGTAIADQHFTPTDPAGWPVMKRLTICSIYANHVVNRYQDGPLYQPAIRACMEGRPIDLGLDNYQTVEMKRAGFTPSDPQLWSLLHRDEVCDELRIVVNARLVPYWTGAQANIFAVQQKTWCSSFGSIAPIDQADPPAPTRWDYSKLEFLWWSRHVAN